MSVLSAARTLGDVSGWTLSNLTIQKTLYIAQMLHLGRHQTPLFREHFEAWDYGPVVPALYRVAKRFGASPLTDVFTVAPFDAASDEAVTVRDAYEATRHMSPGQLVEYTHRTGGAWEAYYREGYRGTEIPIEAIFQEWKTATKPSSDALAWANEMADQLEESPGRYLDYSDERTFRDRVFEAHLN